MTRRAIPCLISTFVLVSCATVAPEPVAAPLMASVKSLEAPAPPALSLSSFLTEPDAWSESAQPPFEPALFAATPVAEETGHGHHPHHLALFLGLGVEARNGHKEEDGIAIGLEYEHRFHGSWGVGLAAEVLRQDTFRELVLVVPVSYHPGATPWRLFGGPGFETNKADDKWLFRLGAGYQFDVAGGWSLAPELVLDMVETGENVWLLGLAIGRGF